MTVLINAYSTLVAPPALSFEHTLNARRDRRDPELAPHLQGFVGFVMRAEPDMTATLYATLRHIQRVQNHLSFEVEQAQLDAMAKWAWQANAILLLPNGCVLNPSGEELVDEDGQPADAPLPFPPDAIDRLQATTQELEEMGLSLPGSLPPVIGEGEVVLRQASDVAGRALALFSVALRAESINEGEALSVEAIEALLPPAFSAVSPKEREFIDNPSPDEQTVVNHAWRYEGAFLLLWALGAIEQLPAPTGICDVPELARLVREQGAAIAADPKLRPTSEILDVLDQTFRMHWAVRQAVSVNKTPPPADLEPGVLQERHVALNWLVRFEDADWDDVDTPT